LARTWTGTPAPLAAASAFTSAMAMLVLRNGAAAQAVALLFLRRFPIESPVPDPA